MSPQTFRRMRICMATLRRAHGAVPTVSLPGQARGKTTDTDARTGAYAAFGE